MSKRARCYNCWAYDGLESPGYPCLVGEKFTVEKTKQKLEMMYPCKKSCRVKNRKDYINRAEEYLCRLQHN